jgi:hypothetical protein
MAKKSRTDAYDTSQKGSIGDEHAGWKILLLGVLAACFQTFENIYPSNSSRSTGGFDHDTKEQEKEVNHYEVLGLPNDACLEDVKKAYRFGENNI